MTRVGEKLKQLRSESKMTQKALGKKLGVSESFINEIECGRKVANEAIINRISKIFGKSLDDVNMYSEEEPETVKKQKTVEFKTSSKKENINEVWEDALSSILKNVPVYKKDLRTVIEVRQLPVISNKIEGYGQDKVFFLEIDNNDMIGFRMAEGDIAFAHNINEAQNNAICLLEYNGERIIRQLKKIDASKMLLISNASSVRTQTVNVKDLKILAKLERVEIKL